MKTGESLSLLHSFSNSGAILFNFGEVGDKAVRF